MFLETISVGPLETNCYIIAAEHAKEAIVIDPGDNAGMIMDTIAAEDLDVKYVLLTHAHWDHFGAAFEVAEKTGAKIAIHTLDKPALTAPEKSLAFMFEADSTNSTGGLKVDMELEDGQSIKFGDIEAHILHTPGHSPGSVSVLIGDSLFTGDLIFYRSIGRTDFAGGSHSALMKSVNEKIFKYPDQVKIYPGHGPATTVGDERKNNPYF